MHVICFTSEEMQLFSAASYDTNPLHMSRNYARRTPFGEPVVFGILSTLAALGCLPPLPGRTLAQVTVDFRNPLFVGISYTAQVTEKSTDTDTQYVVEFYEGRRLSLQARFAFATGAPFSALPGSPADVSRREPVDRDADDLPAGTVIEGVYLPEASAIARLMERWQLAERGVGASQVTALLWTSYMVGMEMPGRRAAYSRLAMTFPPMSATAEEAFRYRAQVEAFDPRFALLRFEAQLQCGEQIVASAKIQSFIRANSPEASPADVAALMAPSNRLAGKVALVIGGSRGLGARIVQALALQGCLVYLNYQHSEEEAAAVRDGLQDGPGEVRLLPGDAADGDWIHAAEALLKQHHGGLDILVCNASPAIRPLHIEMETLPRFEEFVTRSLALVSVPIAQMKEALEARHGWCVVISSIYAQTAPAAFPHYVAAKCAIEGLVHTLAAQNRPCRYLLPRPPKLLTDQTNTPVGRHDTLPTEQVAVGIVAHLFDTSLQSSVEILQEFPAAA